MQRSATARTLVLVSYLSCALIAACENAPGDTDSDAGPEPECTSPATCPAGSSPCAVATCDDGECGLAPASSGTVCRAAAGPCDVAEACDGSTTACPANALAATTVECRAAAGPCDVAETCDGSYAACPVDAFAAATVECRGVAGSCDVAETCTGSAAACPADAYAAATVECRAAAGACDAVETCGGASVECAADTGIAALCQPTTPIAFSALARDLTLTTVDLNGTGSPVATVAVGATVSLHVVGAWVDTNTSCPDCITQFYARLNGVFSLCLGSTTEGAAVDATTTFTAPSTPGVYIINPAASWEFSCVTNTAVSTDFSASSIATLIVQ